MIFISYFNKVAKRKAWRVIMTSAHQSFANKIRQRYSLFVLLVFFLTLTLMLMFDIVSLPHTEKLRRRDDIKYILLYNSYYGYPYYGLTNHDGRDVFLDQKCPVNNCYVTETRTLMPEEDFDALIFHVYHFKKPSTAWPWGKEFVPLNRKPHQRYVFLVFESPIYTGGDLKEWGNFFNWTLTYRSDSDIPSPYGRVLPKNASDFYPVLPPVHWLAPDNEGEDYHEIVGGKTRLLAWLVSHCDTQSKREEYVKLLSAEVTVDQFGDCHGEHWPKNDLFGFYEKVQKEFKFYLSFENSLCKEYVTEKFFNLLKYNVVPIVYGDTDYKTIAPPMSYINALDYDSPKELAAYLKHLDKNPKEYSKYFWWKKHYTISNIRVPQFISLCKLCEMLHADLPAKTYSDLHKWWTEDRDGNSICRGPNISP